ncbi:MAG: 6-bladed beta-propeller [Bacteroidales bacterium]|nr:6-bladed beta-propeller [Bacteroidales bacterium]
MKFLLVILIVITTSCQRNHENQKNDFRVLDIEGNVGKGRVAKISEIADEVLYIPLETSKECLVNEPNRGVKYYSGLIYIVSSENPQHIKIFDTTGRYIRIFNRFGRGPQEYDYIQRLRIESATKNLLISTPTKLCEYTPDGNFIRRTLIPTVDFTDKYGFREFIKLNDNRFVLSLSINKKSKYSAIVIDSLSDIKALVKYPESEIALQQKIWGNMFNPYMYKFRNQVRIINSNDEYVISLNDEIKPDTAFVFNYGKYKMTANNIHYRPSMNDNYIDRSSLVYESDRYLFMQFNMRGIAKKHFVIYYEYSSKIKIFPIAYSYFDKKTGEFNFIYQPDKNQFGFADDIGGGPALWPIEVSDDGYMICYLNALEFLEYAKSSKASDSFKKIANTLKDTDNPVIVRVKLKK